VIDTAGGKTLERAFAVLRRGGRLVTLSTPPAAGKADEFGVPATFFIVVSDCDQLTKLTELVDTSGLQVAIFLQVLCGVRKSLAPQFLNCSECLLSECDGRVMLHGAGPVAVVILLVDERVPMV
jgi:hypothetical protein